MTWPTNAVAANSAVAAWTRLVAGATSAKDNAGIIRLRLAAGTLALRDLRVFLPRVRALRAQQVQLEGTTGLQAYARVATGNASFDLTAESDALKALYTAVLVEGRALHNGLADAIGADGSVTEAPETVPVAAGAAFDAALVALITGVG